MSPDPAQSQRQHQTGQRASSDRHTCPSWCLVLRQEGMGQPGVPAGWGYPASRGHPAQPQHCPLADPAARGEPGPPLRSLRVHSRHFSKQSAGSVSGAGGGKKGSGGTARGQQAGSTPHSLSRREPPLHLHPARKRGLFPADELLPLHLWLSSASIYFKLNLRHLFIHPEPKHVLLGTWGQGSSPREGSRAGWGSFTARLMIQLSQQRAPVIRSKGSGAGSKQGTAAEGKAKQTYGISYGGDG